MADGIDSISTPGQVDALRQYAQALMGQGIPSGSSGNVTAVSPWGGASHMVGSLLGARMMQQAGGQERAALQGGAAASTPEFTGMGGASNSFSPAGSPEGASPYAGITAGQESGGNYYAVGQPTHDGDRAYGKYQVMGKNIPQWTAEVLGQPMTPQQFLANPQAQEAVYNRKFGELVQKYGPEGASKAWFAGEKGMNNPNAQAHRPDGTPFGPTVSQYGQQFAKGLGQQAQNFMPQPAQQPAQQPTSERALAFSGEAQPDTPPMPGSPASTALALSGGGRMPPGPAAPNMGVGGGVGPGVGNQYPTSLVPHRPYYTQEQFQQVMANPYVSPEMKQFVLGTYSNQYQPLSVEGAYGMRYVVDPWNPNNQIVLPPASQNLNFKSGSSEATVPTIMIPPSQPGGVPQLAPMPWAGQGQGLGGAQPQPQAAPQATPGMRPPDLIPQTPKAGAPAQPSQTPQGAAPAGTPPAAENQIPMFAEEADKGGFNAAAQASGGLPPEITQGKSKPGGMLAEPPPPGLAFTPQQPKPLGGEGEAPKGTPPAPGGNFAQPQMPSGAGPGFIPPQVQQFFNYGQQRDIDTEAAKKFNDADITQYNDDYKQNQKIQTDAYNLDNMLSVAENIIHDPRFIQGPGHNLRMGWNQFLAFLGDQDAQAKVGLVNTFDKITAGDILSDMRQKLAGLGQVRLAEIDLLKQATGSKYNTFEANTKVLDVARRFQQQSMQVGSLANAYRQGYRWNADGSLMTDGKGNPIMSSQMPTAAGQNQVINTYLANHPLFSPEEIKNYTAIFKADKEGGAQPGTSATLPKGFVRRPNGQ